MHSIFVNQTAQISDFFLHVLLLLEKTSSYIPNGQKGIINNCVIY